MRAAVLALLEPRAAGATVCPSEVARVLAATGDRRVDAPRPCGGGRAGRGGCDAAERVEHGVAEEVGTYPMLIRFPEVVEASRVVERQPAL